MELSNLENEILSGMAQSLMNMDLKKNIIAAEGLLLHQCKSTLTK